MKLKKKVMNNYKSLYKIKKNYFILNKKEKLIQNYYFNY